MVIKVGDPITKESIITPFNETITTAVGNEFPVNLGNLPRHLADAQVNFVFGSLILANTSGLTEPTPTAVQVATVFNKFFTNFCYAKTIRYYETVGNWTNGGAITYSTTYSTTYKGLVSPTNTAQPSWTNGAPSSNKTTQGFGRASTPAPYSRVNMNVLSYFSNASVVRGEPIKVENFYNMLNNLLVDLRQAVSSQEITLTFTSCHSNCHNSCHSSRSRR